MPRCGCHTVTPRIVRWWGVRWIGIPAPLRWVAWVVAVYMRRTDQEWPEFNARIPGCGCIMVLRMHL